MGMVVWLFVKADSKTAFVCAFLAAGILLAMRFPGIKSRVGRIEIYALGLILLFLVLNAVFDLSSLFIQALGRQTTLSGRTLIWERLFSIPINPLLGTGYYSFWLDRDRVQTVSEGFFYDINEAHNGYIEVYLNEGLIGVFLLAALLISALQKIKYDVLNGKGGYPAVRLALLVIAVVYNYTEAAFDRLHFILFPLLLAIVGYLDPLAETRIPPTEQPLEDVLEDPLVEASGPRRDLTLNGCRA
jgi:O-antigen ligase